MIIRFTIGKYALSGDLQQFYCSCKLLATEMNLTRFLYDEDLDESKEPQECAFQALGFGLKSASGQSEAVKKYLPMKSEVRNLILLCYWNIQLMLMIWENPKLILRTV